jgi:hypothetical protein
MLKDIIYSLMFGTFVFIIIGLWEMQQTMPV